MTHTATLHDGTQLLIENWDDGTVTVATRENTWSTWGPPVEAVKAWQLLAGASVPIGRWYWHPYGPLLSMSTPSGWVTLTPVGNDWTLTIGCWTGTVEALRELIAGEDWPDADEHERLRRRPILSALADLCDAHIAYYGTNPLGSPTEAVKA